jgi:hypothetical protein
MQLVIFTVLGIALYLVADRILVAFEVRAGRRFEHRSLIFFAILLPMAVLAFSLVQRIVGAD